MLSKFKCIRMRKLFVEYIDGGLDGKPKLKSKFDEHMSACEECRRAFEDYKDVVIALRSVASEELTPPSKLYEHTCEAVLKHLEGLTKHQKPAWVRLLPQSALSMSAVMAVAMAMVFVLLRTPKIERQPESNMVMSRAESVAGAPSSLSSPPLSRGQMAQMRKVGEAQQGPIIARERKSKIAIARAPIDHPAIGTQFEVEGKLAERIESVETPRAGAGEFIPEKRPLISPKIVEGEAGIPKLPTVEPSTERGSAGEVVAGGMVARSDLTKDTALKGLEKLRGPEGPHAPKLSAVPSIPASEMRLSSSAARPETVPQEIEKIAEQELKEIHRKQPSFVHQIQEKSVSQLMLDLDISQASPAVLNQRGIWFMVLRPRQNIGDVRVLAYAPKFIDVTAVQALSSQRQVPEDQPAHEPIPIWEGNLTANEAQFVPVPINPLMSGTQEVRLVIESANKVIGGWLVLYPVAKAPGQFGEHVGGRIVSVKAKDWRLADLCRYLASRIGSVIIFPAELADVKTSLAVENVRYEQLLKLLESQLRLRTRLSGNVTVLSHPEEKLQPGLQHGR